ncbi:helix-turn-helix domain-containing protein [Eubacterium sp. MSJ-13]|uniref:excisionase n=1 Tax=Eubacterium sp. MSJ-13 TaxID=2841513 RepID=UPI001C118894|nr:excisionase [Eubacterium sp. MSJ-13]MBU5477646.1 helix-turn-helix domain-containing protein [Eubacterium sp. MSJ-13]
MTDDRALQIPFWLKLNMTIQEAAQYSNIGETTIRGLLKERACPFLLKIGNKQLIKRNEFEKYLADKHYL